MPLLHQWRTDTQVARTYLSARLKHGDGFRESMLYLKTALPYIRNPGDRLYFARNSYVLDHLKGL